MLIKWNTNDTDNTLHLSGDKKRHGIVSMSINPDYPETVREPYFLMNLYRVLGDNSLLSVARDEPFETIETPEGMTLIWKPTVTLPLHMQAVYTVGDDLSVTLDVSIEAVRPISRLELSVSSYFNFNYEPYGILNVGQPGQPRETALWKADDQPFVRGSYIYLARDDDAIVTRLDGRWNDPKSGKTIASAVYGNHYGAPVALMKLSEAEDDLYIAQVASPESCSGISLTYASPNEKDVIRLHNATYFTLFGEDLNTGDKRSATIRQSICRGTEGLKALNIL